MRLAILAALLLSACGGSPTSPTTTVPVTAPLPSVARDGITGQEVSGPVQISGGMASVNVPGYLPRSQPSSPVVWLWPQEQEYVRQLVYVSSVNGSQTALRRWRGAGPIRVGIDETRYLPLLEEKLSELRGATKLDLVALGRQDASNHIRLIVDPGQAGDFLGTATVALNGGWIGGATIYFRSANQIGVQNGDTLMHELGHALGLHHSNNTGDVMHQRQQSSSRGNLSGREAQALTMMYAWRKSGNTFPDNEPQSLPASQREVFTIACR